MYKMAVIGDIDSIYGFASLGLSVFDTTEENEALKIISELVKSNFAVIYITEPLFEKISEKSKDGEYLADVLMVAKYFERIGDHAVNIAEWVEYSITGVHMSDKKHEE